MKAVLMSIRHNHILDIHSGRKTSELRTRPPRIPAPFKVYNLDTKSSGGCGKVVSEWICTDIAEWQIQMGIPAHLSQAACVSDDHIQKYSCNGAKNISEMKISNLVIYNKPKDLNEFRTPCKEYEKSRPRCGDCDYYYYESNESVGSYEECTCDGLKHLTRPPQSWCFVCLEDTNNLTEETK